MNQIKATQEDVASVRNMMIFFVLPPFFSTFATVMCDFLDRDLFPVWGGVKFLLREGEAGMGENVHDQGTRTDLYEIFKHHSKEIRNLLFVRLLHLARRGRGAQSPEKNDKIRVVRTHPNRRSNRIRRNPGFRGPEPPYRALVRDGLPDQQPGHDRRTGS